MQQWFNVEGERHLLEAESVEESGERMELILNTFTGFLIEANVSGCFKIQQLCLSQFDCKYSSGIQTVSS